MNFVRAVAYRSYLALPAAFTQPGAHLLAEPSWEDVCLSIRLSKRKVDGGKPLICLLACSVPQGLGSIHRFGSLVCCSCRLPLAVAGKEINDAALPDSSASAATSSPWLPSPRWPQIIQGLITKGNFATLGVANMIVSFIHGHHKSKAFWGHP